jgi:hypothetical protein
VPGIFPQHEDVRGFGPRHGGGGRFLRRRWSAGVLWLDRWILIWHLVPAGEECIPVKTEPDFGLMDDDDTSASLPC